MRAGIESTGSLRFAAVPLVLLIVLVASSVTDDVPLAATGLSLAVTSVLLVLS